MTRLEKKTMNSPDETRTFDKGKIELTKIGDASIARIYLEPGWSWEKCINPIVKTESCHILSQTICHVRKSESQDE